LGKSHRKVRKVRKDIAAKLCVLCELCGAYVQAFPPAGNWTLSLAISGEVRLVYQVFTRTLLAVHQIP